MEAERTRLLAKLPSELTSNAHFLVLPSTDWIDCSLQLKGNILIISPPNKTNEVLHLVCVSNYDVVLLTTDVIVLVSDFMPNFQLAFSGTHEPAEVPFIAEKWFMLLFDNAHRVCNEDFEFIKVLGLGGFADVHLVRKVDTGEFFAMKVLGKKLSIAKPNDADVDRKELVAEFDAAVEQKKRKEKKSMKAAAEERAFLTRNQHPFICKLCYSFQDETAWYLCLEHVENQCHELQKNQPYRSFTEEVLRVWAAELVSGICFMHSNRYVHRDLKPENILLDNDWHVRIVDFGFVKKLRKDRQQTNTFCGTRYYMAPELVVGDHSHSFAVDWWALGIILFELACGLPPFFSQDHTELFSQIVSSELTWPKPKSFNGPPTKPMPQQPLSPQFKDFVEKLLTKNHLLRLGASKTKMQANHQAVKTHPFFKGIDWALIDSKKVPIPVAKEQQKSVQRLGLSPRVNVRTLNRKADFAQDLLYVPGFSFSSKVVERDSLSDLIEEMAEKLDWDAESAVLSESGNYSQ